MENRIILLDTSVLIDLFRRKVKESSYFFQIASSNKEFAVSAVTRFEVFVGHHDKQNEFWEAFFQEIKIIDFDDNCALIAANIARQLKIKNQMIEIPDILIGGTAVANNLRLATLNQKHFSRIEGLILV